MLGKIKETEMVPKYDRGGAQAQIVR